MNNLVGKTRRQFLKIATATIGAIISAGITIPGVAYIIGPALKEETEENWLPLGLASKVELGTPTLFKTTVSKQTGWIVNETQLSVYVYTEDGRVFSALSNICTHLGCRVRWIGNQEQFFCPCHNAIFSKTGEVVDGPPPRPLDKYEVKVEEDQLYILGG